MAGNSIIYHYHAIEHVPVIHSVAKGSKIISAALRQGMPAVYVESPVIDPDTPRQTLEVVYHATGVPFINSNGLKFVATVGDGLYFWHVYGRIY